MLQRFKRGVLLQGLTLLLFVGTCEASSLGLTVHVEPLLSYGGEKVRAHFSAITAGPCQNSNELCDSGEDCLVHKTSLPFVGTKPAPGWCVRQWQKTISSTFRSSISVGSNTEVFVAIKAAPEIRENSGRLNRPPYVGLLPPVRARVDCPHHFDLSVKDLDGDKVQCRFARQDLGECFNCPQHSFVELNEEKCRLRFDGKAEPGQYFIYLMAEDFIPAPPSIQLPDNKPLSSIPVHISLTVEESTTKCSDEPVVTGETPKEDFVDFVLPYHEVKFDINYDSQRESVSEVAVVGPPDLQRVNFKSVGPFSSMTMGWIRSENNTLPRLIPICFAVNTENLQSDPRCVWLYQRELRTLPDGTVLKCEKTSMTLVLPITSLKNINLAELQLNSATCPVTYNSTHLTATISLDGCGTKTVHSGSELVYTNTLRSVHPFTKVSRTPSLILPLACRIPGVQAKGPQYQIAIPTEEETFGKVRYWIEFYMPGKGPLARFTRIPQLRSLRMPPVQTRLNTVLRSENTVFSSRSTSSNNNSNSTNNNTSNDPITSTTPPSSSNNSTNSSDINTTTRSSRTTTPPAIGSRLNVLDLHVMSNCTIDRAEMVISKCIRSKTQDFAEFSYILKQGCSTSNNTLEVITTKSGVKVYRLYLSTGDTKETTMYVECIVNLCIATLPSQKCPDLCTRTFTPKTLVDSVYTQSYTIRSGPVSLVVTTPAPATTTAAKTTAGPTTTTVAPTAQITTSSHAPEKTSALAVGVVLTTISIFLQKVLLY